MKKILLYTLLVIISGSAFSQELITPYLTLQYFRNSGDSSYLKTTVTYSKNRVEIPVAGLKLSFWSGGEMLKEAVTDFKGVVTCYLNTANLKKDSEGFWPFFAKFEGNDTIEATSAELKIINASLFMECSSDDSIKTVSVRAEKQKDGKMIPAAGEVVNVYVTRMFNPLPVGEITLDEEGKGSVEFPGDLPGDLNGSLTIVARIDEHPEFGNLEKKQSLQWGVPFVATNHTSRRALWTKTAPKWMIYTLTILLAGVWSHYMFAIISLIRIKLDARRNKKKTVKADDFFIKS